MSWLVIITGDLITVYKEGRGQRIASIQARREIARVPVAVPTGIL